MQLGIFHKYIVDVINKNNYFDPLLALAAKELLVNIDKLLDTSNQCFSLQMTRMTIMFEGFYRSLPDGSPLKEQLLEVRLKRWKSHFGIPTITFLLSYHNQIDTTRSWFNQIADLISLEPKPWDIQGENLSIDSVNTIVVDENSVEKVIMPKEDEKTGQFLKTHNPYGGFTTTPCDAYSQKFIEYAKKIAETNGKILEIGAAFGAASLEALAQGATLFCNDIEPHNLAVIKNRFIKKVKSNQQYSITGDDEKLILISGMFPDELSGLPNDFFDAILICRVLHFFSGNQIEKSLEQLYGYLKPGGKLIVVCETPFLKNWKNFIPEYEKRVANNYQWPGEITNPVDFENSGRAASLPKFVHWITKEILERSLLKARFGVEQISYIDRSGQFPSDLLLDKRESVGAVAVKPY